MADLLVVEDEEKIGQLLVSALVANGYTVTWRRDGAGALAAARSGAFDLALLDLGLPDVDGIDVCRTLKREQTQCVVVVLTARRAEMDVIEGLESGADDYLTKPFRMTELLARVRAHLRRASVDDFISGPFTSGDLSLDPAARRCVVGGREVALRPKEFDLLARLVAEPGRAVTREVLMDDVWDRTGSVPPRPWTCTSPRCGAGSPRQPTPPIPRPGCRRSPPCAVTATGSSRSDRVPRMLDPSSSSTPPALRGPSGAVH